MGQRMISTRGAVAACAAVAALVFASIHLGAQSDAVTSPRAKAAKPAKAWTMPRTADGQPDLTGNWTNATYTPLERPANLGTKEFYTKEEAVTVEKERVAQFNSQAADDIHYDNAIWQNENYDKGLSSLRTSLVIDPPDGRIPALTDEARRRAAPPQAGSPDRRTDSYENRTLAERCITWGNDGPPIMPVGYNANLDILQGPGYVVVRTEMIHSARIIPIDGARPHIGQNIRKWNGDSRGHWEGNTLVVETTNFNDKTRFQRSSQNMKLVERFTRTAPDTVMYEFTVDDPSAFTKPWTAQIPMKKTEGPIIEYACNEGNYAMEGMLAGARADEKKAASK
jgi:hypothetical protein